MRRWFIAALLPLAACSPAPGTPPLAGARIGGPIALIDQDGRPFGERQLAGKYRIVYLGYTFCPDVCPTDAQAIGAALRQLEATRPALAAKIVPLFITVDPGRDTPAVLKQFVRAFHPRFVGLTGSPAQIAATAKAFGVFVAKGDPTPNGGYLVNHSRATYLMDPAGQPLALLPTDRSPDAVVAELERWVR